MYLVPWVLLNQFSWRAESKRAVQWQAWTHRSGKFLQNGVRIVAQMQQLPFEAVKRSDFGAFRVADKQSVVSVRALFAVIRNSDTTRERNPASLLSNIIIIFHFYVSRRGSRRRLRQKRKVWKLSAPLAPLWLWSLPAKSPLLPAFHRLIPRGASHRRGDKAGEWQIAT